jgi:hypothetical protein
VCIYVTVDIGIENPSFLVHLKHYSYHPAMHACHFPLIHIVEHARALFTSFLHDKCVHAKGGGVYLLLVTPYTTPATISIPTMMTARGPR